MVVFMANSLDCPWEFLFPDVVLPPKSFTSSKPLDSLLIDGNKRKNDSVLTSSPLSQQQKTFAQAVSNAVDVPYSQLPKSRIIGDELTIKIPEDEYLAGLNECKNHLYG